STSTGSHTRFNALRSSRSASSRALERLGRGGDAERELRGALKRVWDPVLVETYGKVRSGDTGKQLKQAETWLRERPDDAALLIAAARLCMASELWGK